MLKLIFARKPKEEPEPVGNRLPPGKRLEPTRGGLMNEDFEYVDSHHTDIRKRFDRAKEQIAREKRRKLAQGG